MLVADTRHLPTFYADVSGPRRVFAAPVPQARRRASLLTVSAALVVTAQAPDPHLALRAGLAVRDELEQGPSAHWGFPLRRPVDEAKLGTRQQLSPDEVEAIMTALENGRGLPQTTSAQITHVLVNRLMGPIVDGLSVDAAARDAAAALDQVLSV